MATISVPGTGNEATVETLQISDDLKMLLNEYKQFRSNFVAIPDTVLSPAILAKFGKDGTTAQTMTFDFSNAKNVSSVAKTTNNLGKKVGAVKCTATMGQDTFFVRLNLNQAEAIVESGNPTWETIVKFSPNAQNPEQPWSNLEPVKPAA